MGRLSLQLAGNLFHVWLVCRTPPHSLLFPYCMLYSTHNALLSLLITQWLCHMTLHTKKVHNAHRKKIDMQVMHVCSTKEIIVIHNDTQVDEILEQCPCKNQLLWAHVHNVKGIWYVTLS